MVHDRPTVPPYRTADRWLFLSGNFQNHYAALCQVLDAPELLSDPRFIDVRARNTHSAELKHELADASPAAPRRGARAAAAWPARLSGGRGAHHARGPTIPHLRDRTAAAATTKSHGHEEPVNLMNAAFVAERGRAPGCSGPVPGLGGHTDEVLRSSATAPEITELREDGAI